jgi:hypothetical protein
VEHEGVVVLFYRGVWSSLSIFEILTLGSNLTEQGGKSKLAPERGGVVSAAYAPWRLQKDIDNVEFNDKSVS